MIMAFHNDMYGEWKSYIRYQLGLFESTAALFYRAHLSIPFFSIALNRRETYIVFMLSYHFCHPQAAGARVSAGKGVQL